MHHISAMFKRCHHGPEMSRILSRVLGQWTFEQARGDCEYSSSSLATAAFEVSYIGKWQGTSLGDTGCFQVKLQTQRQRLSRSLKSSNTSQDCLNKHIFKAKWLLMLILSKYVPCQCTAAACTAAKFTKGQI